MSRIRSAFALGALCLCAAGANGQSATPAVSTVVAFSISNPVGNLSLGPDGALYGVVAPATSIAGGLVYRAATDGSAISTLYQLSPTQDGFTPGAGLTLGSDGLLYGVTKFGRATETFSSGTVFRMSPTGTDFTVLHRFAAYTTTTANTSPQNEEGVFPETELIEGADHYLYGVTTAGGPQGTGVVFKVSRDGSDFKVLHSFSADTDTGSDLKNADGATPLGQLVQGADGMLYGTTSAGGLNGLGTIFRVSADGAVFEVLYHFEATTADTTTGLAENATGAVPLAGLVDGGDGFFYGVTSVGGATGQGVVFSLSAIERVQHGVRAAHVRWRWPVAELLLGTDGRLYGTTTSGGLTSSGSASTLGTMFVLERAGNNPTATNLSRLHSFASDVGSVPSSKLVQASGNVFLGTVQNGGKCGYGAVYRYSGAGDTVTGNTKCGNTGKNNNNGGGAGEPALLLMLGTLLALRRKVR